MKKRLYSKSKVIFCAETSADSGIYALKLNWHGTMIRPGQFVALKPFGSKNPSVMIRPFTVAEYNGKTITLIIQVVGNNTQLFSQLKEGDEISVSKPLGKPIPISKTEENFTLIGGGMGTAALMPLAKYLCLRHTTVLLGSKKSSQLFGQETFRKVGFFVKTITEDRKSNSGIVTDLLEKAIRKEKEPSTIIACGPRAMLKKVAEIAKTHGRKCIVIVEEIMACATGSCKGCAIFGTDKSVKHVCTDGPAFDANWIDWEKFFPSRISIESNRQPARNEEDSTSLGLTIVGQNDRKLKLEYPILNASGCLGEEAIEKGCIDIRYAGALVTKGVTMDPRSGNAMPRICEIPYGMMNSIGLENPGTKEFIETKLPIWLSAGKPIIVNVSGFSIEEYGRSAELLSETEIAGQEINVSCPNIDQGHGNKKIFGLSPDLTFKVITISRIGAPKMFLIAKLSPMASDIVEIAQAARDAGADAISLINTPLGMAIDIWTRRPRIGNLYGGMSGPQIKPMAIRMINQLFNANLGIPIIGMGGIMCGEDAAELILAGANAIAVGTALFSKSDEIFPEIHTTLKKFVSFHKANNLQELVGKIEK